MGEFDEAGKDAVPVIPDKKNADSSQKSKLSESPQPQGYPQQPYAPQPQGYLQQPYAPQPQGYPQQPYAPQPQGYPQQPYAPQPQGYPQQPYAPQPQGYAQQPYAPQLQGYPQQPYAPQLQGYPQQPYAPQLQGYPQQPYAPQPQGYPQQPYAPQPRRNKPSGKLNTGAFTLAICFTALIVLQVLLGVLGRIVFGGGIITGLIVPLVGISAGVLLILGVYRRSKIGNTLFAVGLFAIAFSLILRILASMGSSNIIFYIASAIMALSAGVSGVTYLVNKKTFDTIKLVLIIIMIATVTAQHVIGLITNHVSDLYLIVITTLYILPYAALGVCAILFKPVKQA